jgi:hypothetical protein
MTDSQPLPQIIDEARRMLAAAQERAVPVRLIGGLAVRLRFDAAVNPRLTREYKDIDVVTLKRTGKAAGDLLASLGYVGDREFNTLNGKTRLLYYDNANRRQVDVFVGAFEMCHSIPITDRIVQEDMTVPLAELLLMKLQVVALNEKDLRDIIALLHYHDVGDEDGPTVNGSYIAALCAADWGLWRTSTANLDRAHAGVDDYELDEQERAIVRGRIDDLRARLDAYPKSTKWRLRDRVGDRKRWYLEPEEVNE